MAWTPDDIPDLTGRVAVVTGANGGLGLVTAHELAAKGAHVVMAARDQEKARTAEGQIRARNPEASARGRAARPRARSRPSRAAAKAILGAHERIDILVNNAGVMAMPERRTDDGFEMQFGVDHLGHFALTAHLLPAAAAGRAGPRRHRHQRRPLPRPRPEQGQPAPRRRLPAVAGLRPGQAGQLPLRARPAAAVREGRRQRARA